MIPFRTRRILGRICAVGLTLLLIVSVLLLFWLLWLNRYVVYTRNGAYLDFDRPLEYPQGELAVPPTAPGDVDIFYGEGSSDLPAESTELTRLAGLYISAEMLASDLDAVEAAVKALPAETPVMLDVKSIRGEFYYSTAMGSNAPGISPERMDGLISYLRRSGHYLIARLPALRDRNYGLNHVNDGVFNPNRLSLWMDSEGCYWLNPNAEGTLTYLVQIVTELRTLGFDEVVLTDFRLPDTDNIYFEGDKVEAVNQTAANLLRICGTDTFAVSFANSADTFRLPEGRSRLYFEEAAAADADILANRVGVEAPDIRVVFLTDLMDTRFDTYGVLRPLNTN